MTRALAMENVSVRYGDVVALDQITAEIPRGASVAIIGPNGSGKSTLLKAVVGIESMTTGRIDHFGNTCSIVLQSTEVDRSIPFTVRDTIAMGRYPRLGLLRRPKSTDRAAIAQAVNSMGLEELLDRQIHNLSGGQRQRTMVAQGLAQEADLLLLDEPMGGLDVVSQTMIVDALHRARQGGATTVVTTHSFDEAKRCDLVMLLATRCVAFGTPEVVLSEHHLRQAFGGRLLTVGDTMVLDDPHHEPHHAG